MLMLTRIRHCIRDAAVNIILVDNSIRLLRRHEPAIYAIATDTLVYATPGAGYTLDKAEGRYGFSIKVTSRYYYAAYTPRRAATLHMSLLHIL